jgi:glycine cleavage system protein P-like pyridoxal-binding family
VIVALIPDLLFGSNVVGALTAAGHEVKLVSTLDGAVDAQLLIVDLTADAPERIAALPTERPPTLAFYSHVETDVRELAEQAGIDLVVPRSRMAREGAALAERLIAAG